VTTLLLGGGGLLGSGFRAALRREGRPVVRLSPRWADLAALEASLPGDLERVLAADDVDRVVWAAGVGHVGAGTDTMRIEASALRLVCDAVRDLPPDRRRALTVVFASSAGAVYGGHGGDEITDETPPAPVAAYGHEKLAQEAELRRLAADAGCRVLTCRYSNLYGLNDGRLPLRGLIPTAVRATRLRQPMTVYVSPDTRRDLLYSPDAAAWSLKLARTAPPGFSVRIVCDGQTRTVADVLALVGRVSRRRVPVTYATRPETRLQPRVLRFSRPSSTPDVHRTPMEVAIHRMLRVPLA
jgi:UDP-glucose 4-epimerase